MKVRIATASIVAALLLNAGFMPAARAEESPKEPATEAKEHKHDEKKENKKDDKKIAGPKMWGVWKKLASLTPEQKVKMADIHDQALAAKRKIDDQEELDLMAVLTDEQKVELQKIKEEADAKRKAKEGEKDKKKDDDKEKKE